MLAQASAQDEPANWHSTWPLQFAGAMYRQRLSHDVVPYLHMKLAAHSKAFLMSPQVSWQTPLAEFHMQLASPSHDGWLV
jgi:hypothetical protein